MRTTALRFGSALFGLTLLAPSIADARPWYKRAADKVTTEEKAPVATPLDQHRLKDLLVRFDKARAAKDPVAVKAIDQELASVLDHQLDQGTSKAGKNLKQLYETTRRSVEKERLETTGVREAYVDTNEYRQLRAIRNELRTVAGREDEASLAFRRERIVRVVAIAEKRATPAGAPTRSDKP